jgi:hypothetical protein
MISDTVKGKIKDRTKELAEEAFRRMEDEDFSKVVEEEIRQHMVHLVMEEMGIHWDSFAKKYAFRDHSDSPIRRIVQGIADEVTEKVLEREIDFSEIKIRSNDKKSIISSYRNAMLEKAKYIATESGTRRAEDAIGSIIRDVMEEVKG